MTRGDSDKLLTRIRNDDAVAFRNLFDQWYTPLCRHAVTFVGDQQAAEDIVQELFITLWTNREKLSITVSARSYLFRAVRNRSLNFLRDTRKYHVDHLDSLPELPETDYEQDTEEDESMRQLHVKALEAIGELPDRCRMIFNMSRNSELTNKEIARKLDLSEKTIENQITIALKKLRTRLGPYLDKIIFLGLSVGLFLVRAWCNGTNHFWG